MDGVLLTGGLASRLRPITTVTNKHLLPVYNKPMIFYGIELLKELGCERVIIILGGNSVGDIVNLVRDGSQFGVEVVYKYQNEPKGISHAIALAEDVIRSEDFLVLLGDNLYGNVALLKEKVNTWAINQRYTWTDGYAQKARFCIFTTESATPWEYGQPNYRIDMAYDGLMLCGFVEKQKNVGHNKIVTGLYGLTTEAFDIIRNQKPSERGEYEITDTLMGNILDISEWIYTGFWSDCGTPEGLVEAAKYFREGKRNEVTSKR